MIPAERKHIAPLSLLQTATLNSPRRRRPCLLLKNFLIQHSARTVQYLEPQTYQARTLLQPTPPFVRLFVRPWKQMLTLLCNFSGFQFQKPFHIDTISEHPFDLDAIGVGVEQRRAQQSRLRTHKYMKGNRHVHDKGTNFTQMKQQIRETGNSHAKTKEGLHARHNLQTMNESRKSGSL